MGVNIGSSNESYLDVSILMTLIKILKVMRVTLELDTWIKKHFSR